MLVFVREDVFWAHDEHSRGCHVRCVSIYGILDLCSELLERCLVRCVSIYGILNLCQEILDRCQLR